MGGTRTQDSPRSNPLHTVIAYLTVIVASFAFLELSLGRVRLLIEIVIFAGTQLAAVGLRLSQKKQQEVTHFRVHSLLAQNLQRLRKVQNLGDRRRSF